MTQLFPIEIKKHIYLRSTESTNLFTTNYASNFKPDNNISVYSLNQTKGRGQIGRFWYSGQDQNISLSYFVRLNLPSKNHFELNMAFSLAIYDFLDSLLNNPSLKIKWPNDLYVGNNKIAGILIQNSLRGMQLNNSVLGIGINVNQAIFPDSIPNPTSIFLESGQKQDLLTLISAIHPYVEFRLSQLSVANNLLKQEYLNVLFALNAYQSFQDDNGLFKGKVKGINKDGKLMILRSGILKEYNFRELRYVLK